MKTIRKRKPVGIETIARLAEQGTDVSRFFTNRGQMMGPIQRVNVDLAAGMLEELDRAAKELNISRQAVKRPSYVRHWISNILHEAVAIQASKGKYVLSQCRGLGLFSLSEALRKR